jgi:hypothetical protein
MRETKAFHKILAAIFNPDAGVSDFKVMMPDAHGGIGFLVFDFDTYEAGSSIHHTEICELPSVPEVIRRRVQKLDAIRDAMTRPPQ